MMLIKLVKNHVSCFFFGDPDHKKTNQSVFPRIGSDDKMIVRNRNKRTCVNNKCGEDFMCEVLFNNSNIWTSKISS